MRIAGDTAADAHQPLMGVRAVNGLRDQPQHRGVQRIDLRRELRMAAIHRERVLREVVGADGEEVRLGGKGVRHHGHGGHLHHDAAMQGRDAERGGFLG
jgi:hypothetical protein